MARKKQSSFGWQEGEKLAPEDYEPVPEVRETGLTHLVQKALPADPKLRIEERKKRSQKGNAHFQKKPAKSAVIFESDEELSLSEPSATSQSKHLLKKDDKWKGLSRFLKKPSSEPKK